MPDVLIKICGLKRKEDIEIINKYPIDFAGFIVDYPLSKRSIGIDTLKALVSALDRKKTKAVGVFVNKDIKAVIDLLNSGIIDIAQLHGTEDDFYIEKVKNKTNKTIIKAFEIKEKEDIQKAKNTLADFPLLDKGKGEGSVFNHEFAKGFDRKFFLAGGLNPENISKAINTLCPYAVDLSTYLEDKNGNKDEEKIIRFVNAIKYNNKQNA